MGNLLFKVGLLLMIGIIYLITGKNRRQLNKIPKGMTILCEPPGKRYIIYALAVLVVVVVMFFYVLFLLDGAPEDAESTWTLCIIITFLSSAVLIISGNAMAKDCVYFNSEKLQIEKPFHKSRSVNWYEIRKIDGSFDNIIHLYLWDGTKILTVNAGMIHYDLFCNVLKKKCPDTVSAYYHNQTHNSSKKCVLGCGPVYYILAILGILILAEYAAILASGEDYDLIQHLLQSEPSERFSLLFAPVYGIVSLILLFICCNTKVYYSKAKITFQYPLRRKKDLYWRNITKIEVITKKEQDKMIWKKLRISTAETTYKINFSLLHYRKDEFITELLSLVERYEIPYIETRK